MKSLILILIRSLSHNGGMLFDLYLNNFYIRLCMWKITIEATKTARYNYFGRDTKVKPSILIIMSTVPCFMFPEVICLGTSSKIHYFMLLKKNSELCQATDRQ